MSSRFRVLTADQFRLGAVDPAQTEDLTEEECAATLERERNRIAELQDMLYAEGRRSLLIVLMAMDTGGKDPIIKDVLSAANPQACRVTAFKRANKSEEKHDRFWRFHQWAPAKGEIGVFNRSYFDDIVRDDAHGDLDAAARSRAFEGIRHFERLLAGQDIRILKLFLHISKQEQRTRLQERIDNRHRQWELSEADFTEREYWDGYMQAFERAIQQTHTDYAPWYVLPSDRKWFRDAASSTIIADTLADMDPQYPPPKVDVSKIEWH